MLKGDKVYIIRNMRMARLTKSFGSIILVLCICLMLISGCSNTNQVNGNGAIKVTDSGISSSTGNDGDPTSNAGISSDWDYIQFSPDPNSEPVVVGNYTIVDSVAGSSVVITEYNGLGGDVAIPSKINGKPVVAIGDIVFSLQTNITSVSIPDSVKTIGYAAFDGCTGLTSITIPASVTDFLGNLTFDGCNNLKAVYFEGDAPRVWGNNQFMGASPDLVIYHHKDAKGFETYGADGKMLGTWQGIPLSVY